MLSLALFLIILREVRRQALSVWAAIVRDPARADLIACALWRSLCSGQSLLDGPLASACAQRVLIEIQSWALRLVELRVCVVLYGWILFLDSLSHTWRDRILRCANSHPTDVGLGHYAVLDDGVADPNRLLLEGGLRACSYGGIARYGWSVLSLRLVIEEGLLDGLAGWRVGRRLKYLLTV